MSLHDAVMSSVKKHVAKMKAKMPPLHRETAGKDPDKSNEKNETGEAGDEDMSTYAKKHRDFIKDKKKNQSAKHPGFKAVQGKIQAEGYSQKVAGAILAARSRGASAAAHKANPHLNRVKG